MAITTQDLAKGIDITGLTTVTGSEMNQLVDVARTASDKGLVILTTDSALNTPVIPDPTLAYSGITPSWWVRYIWIRSPFTIAGSMKVYVWNPYIVDDPTYKKWIQINVGDVTTAQLNAVIATVTTAQNAANTAQATADTAEATATSAAADAATALANFISGFNGQTIGGKYKVDYNLSVIHQPLYTRNKLYQDPPVLVTLSTAGAVADTGWVLIDLSAYVSNFTFISNGFNVAAIINVFASSTVEVAGADTYQLAAYVTGLSSRSQANSRSVIITLDRSTPDKAINSIKTQFVVPMSTGTPKIYYAWNSTSIGQNGLVISLEGFIDGMESYPVAP